MQSADQTGASALHAQALGTAHERAAHARGRLDAHSRALQARRRTAPPGSVSCARTPGGGSDLLLAAILCATAPRAVDQARARAAAGRRLVPAPLRKANPCAMPSCCNATPAAASRQKERRRATPRPSAAAPRRTCNQLPAAHGALPHARAAVVAAAIASAAASAHAMRTPRSLSRRIATALAIDRAAHAECP